MQHESESGEVSVNRLRVGERSENGGDRGLGETRDRLDQLQAAGLTRAISRASTRSSRALEIQTRSAR